MAHKKLDLECADILSPPSARSGEVEEVTCSDVILPLGNSRVQFW
jgi:hypothetical protein